ncbi:MAG: carboxypeptidase regulatory-like domain-containing protein [Deltaproteobacteria bacterium]|nr:carboxypeptidase regulatory-like domain-containing protein [Deltaproteobacteria bacterium]
MPAPTRIATRLLALAAFVHLATACGGGGSKSTTNPPPGGNQGALQVAGTVMEDLGQGAGTSALSGAEVRVTIDRNGNGTVDAGESWTATTGATGAYTVSLTVTAGETAVVRFQKSGLAPVIRTLKTAPSTSVPVSATLRRLDTLSGSGSTLSNQNGTVSLTGLPAGASGSARVFNPVTETDAFPGDFSDSTGNRLVSGVFGSFDLKDAANNKLETLTAPATMKMRMPRDTWPAIVDITAGNQQIDVPLYSFREATGEWVRDGSGWLEDASGTRLLPADLPSLRDGSYTGAVFAAGEVTHFSTWNVDWPISSHGCVRGRVVDAAGTTPVAGATVTVSGVSYTGTSTPVTVGSDGRFCVEVMRSEGAGEDVDGDGVAGETSSVKVRVVSGGQVYDFGVRDLTTAAATCSAGSCLDLGDMALTSARRVSAALCTVSGTVFRRDGTTPAAGAMVMGWDDVVPPEVQDALCIQGNQLLCSFFATAGADGSYTFTTASMGGLTVFAMLQTAIVPDQVIELAWAQRLVGDCPTGPVNLRLDEGYVSITTALALNGNVISWTPAGYGATALYATGPAGFKWMVSAPEGQTFPSPVTYGTVPAGASQTFPATGAPAALASGDTVYVLISGKASDGFPYFGSGTLTVP